MIDRLIFEQTTCLPFFVYGTLRTGECNWQSYLKGRTIGEFPATLAGYKLYCTELPYVCAAESEHRVIGNLIYIKPTLYDDILMALDWLEDYDPQNQTGEYLRVMREVQYTDQHAVKQQTQAWVYEASPLICEHLKETEWVQSGDWLNRKAGLRNYLMRA